MNSYPDNKEKSSEEDIIFVGTLPNQKHNQTFATATIANQHKDQHLQQQVSNDANGKDGLNLEKNERKRAYQPDSNGGILGSTNVNAVFSGTPPSKVARTTESDLVCHSTPDLQRQVKQFIMSPSTERSAASTNASASKLMGRQPENETRVKWGQTATVKEESTPSRASNGSPYIVPEERTKLRKQLEDWQTAVVDLEGRKLNQQRPRNSFSHGQHSGEQRSIPTPEEQRRRALAEWKTEVAADNSEGGQQKPQKSYVDNKNKAETVMRAPGLEMQTATQSVADSVPKPSNSRSSTSNSGSNRNKEVMDILTQEKAQKNPGVSNPSTENKSSTKTSATTRPTRRVNNGSSNSTTSKVSKRKLASVVYEYAPEFEILPPKTNSLPMLSKVEITELEIALELDAQGGWRDDWNGNLLLADEEIPNPALSSKKKKVQTFKQSLMHWAEKSEYAVKLLRNLIRFVYYAEGIPEAAKLILCNADVNSSSSMTKAVRRTTFDPVVLAQDGWIIERAQEPMGASGGAYLIGDRLRWQNSDAVVIAYVHDHDIGDLWKAMWTDDDGDVEAFDLEAEELFESKGKWERRQERFQQAQQKQQNPKVAKSADASQNSRRSNSKHSGKSNDDFSIKGIDHGIVLAASYSRGARQGVYWPARIMHASEKERSVGMLGYGKSDRGKQRSSSRQKLDVVFLAPFWNPDDFLNSRSRRAEAMSETASSAFSSTPLFQVETVDATLDMVKEYPFLNRNDDGAKNILDVDQLRMAFRFTGLPKTAFPRFVNSHRLALSLKLYAKEHLMVNKNKDDARAASGLFDSHPLGVQVPVFPSVILGLPFHFILKSMPIPSDTIMDVTEPILQLNTMVSVLKPPKCFGLGTAGRESNPATPTKAAGNLIVGHASATPKRWLASFTDHRKQHGENDSPPLELERFISDLEQLKTIFAEATSFPPILALLTNLNATLSSLSSGEFCTQKISSMNDRREKLATLLNSWAMLKAHGEDTLAICSLAAVADWRRASERIYKYITNLFACEKFGNGVSIVLTDIRCNGHKTSSGCFERTVRLPAALKAAKLAGATDDGPTRLISSIPEQFIKLVEEKVLIKAHSAWYLKRMKSRCSNATKDEDLILTDDSDGNGGEDTRGSRGTWKAAVTGVAASVMAATMVVKGECVNAFCITRPPGHHAGRSLHAMKAVSNGFCVLNPVACAALHAVTPLMEGGLGLGRVCVIDFDVHHGNGTQDILCSTYDPRFFYVSLHAGGAKVNGVDFDEDDPEHELHGLTNNAKLMGIYPGRCGDTSPHQGVLNIPLGPKVTPHAVGSALLSQVTPAVDAFSPDLIILSAGFDAHKNDPMGLGALSSEDFGHITEVACQLAYKSCSGRVISVLEGGYGVPCCRPQKDIFLVPPKPSVKSEEKSKIEAKSTTESDQTVKNEEKSKIGLMSTTESDQTVKNEEKSKIGPKSTTESDQTAKKEEKSSIEPKSKTESDLTGAPSQNNALSITEDSMKTSETKVPLQSQESTTDTGNLPLPFVQASQESALSEPTTTQRATVATALPKRRPQPSKLLDLGEDLPEDMEDQVPYVLQRRIEKCHAEGFLHCVKEHVQALKKCNIRA